MAELRIAVSEDDHVRGDPNARVTIVEYGDYQCPHCQAAQPVLVGLLKHFGSRLRLVYRHFPIVTIHPMAKPAAEAAEYAGSLGRFWDLHDALYANGHRLSMPTVFLLAAQLSMAPAQLRNALLNHLFAPKVDRDFAGGISSGVNGTPCFFINGRRYDGAYDAISLAAAIDAELGGESIVSPTVRI
jgi:protein-disulfide isomerase